MNKLFNLLTAQNDLGAHENSDLGLFRIYTENRDHYDFFKDAKPKRIGDGVRDSAGNLWITLESEHKLLAISPGGNCLISFGSFGGREENLFYPRGLAHRFSQKDEIYVCDSWNHRISQFSFEKNSVELSSFISRSKTGWLTPSGIAFSNNTCYVLSMAQHQYLKGNLAQPDRFERIGSMRSRTAETDALIRKALSPCDRDFNCRPLAPGFLYPRSMKSFADGKLAVFDEGNQRLIIIENDKVINVIDIDFATLSPAGICVLGGMLFVFENLSNYIHVFQRTGLYIGRLNAGSNVFGVVPGEKNGIEIYAESGRILVSFDERIEQLTLHDDEFISHVAETLAGDELDGIAILEALRVSLSSSFAKGFLSKCQNRGDAAVKAASGFTDFIEGWKKAEGEFDASLEALQKGENKYLRKKYFAQVRGLINKSNLTMREHLELLYSAASVFTDQETAGFFSLFGEIAEKSWSENHRRLALVFNITHFCDSFDSHPGAEETETGSMLSRTSIVLDLLLKKYTYINNSSPAAFSRLADLGFDENFFAMNGVSLYLCALFDSPKEMMDLLLDRSSVFDSQRLLQIRKAAMKFKSDFYKATTRSYFSFEQFTYQKLLDALVIEIDERLNSVKSEDIPDGAAITFDFQNQKTGNKFVVEEVIKIPDEFAPKPYVRAMSCNGTMFLATGYSEVLIIDPNGKYKLIVGKDFPSPGLSGGHGYSVNSTGELGIFDRSNNCVFFLNQSGETRVQPSLINMLGIKVSSISWSYAFSKFEKDAVMFYVAGENKVRIQRENDIRDVNLSPSAIDVDYNQYFLNLRRHILAHVVEGADGSFYVAYLGKTGVVAHFRRDGTLIKRTGKFTIGDHRSHFGVFRNPIIFGDRLVVPDVANNKIILLNNNLDIDCVIDRPAGSGLPLFYHSVCELPDNRLCIIASGKYLIYLRMD
ncbi:MAG: hypothetical protein NUW37_08940 [Planctomycetes bacterium]|nr:hypothetical protein [Planctomycetota bacterium]